MDVNDLKLQTASKKSHLGEPLEQGHPAPALSISSFLLPVNYKYVCVHHKHLDLMIGSFLLWVIDCMADSQMAGG